MSQPTLTVGMEVALRDLGAWRGRYFWKPANMARLAQLGLTEKQADGSYTLTAEGQRWLAEHPR